MTHPNHAFLWLTAAVCVLLACAPSQAEDRPLSAATLPAFTERAADAGPPQASLFAGLQFGMGRDSFYAHCRAANARGEMRDGLDNYVRIDLDDAALNVFEFLPNFDKGGSLAALHGRAYALGWSPWRPDLSADSLLERAVVEVRERLGGGDFTELAELRPRTLVQFEPGRLVAIWPDGFQHVRFEVHDLTRADESVLSGDRLLKPKLSHPLLSRLPRVDDEG